ncbi:conserved protein of unknown function [Nitratireductor aquimarinus]|uniref:hypothetical protein n=1 Tax=Nitratireductor aquimarinus TaxID=889300 RepID=UPI003B5B14C8
MAKKPSTFDEKVEFIANFLGDNFLRVARGVRELQDECPDIFLKVAQLAGLSNRKAYALARIARQFENVPEQRLFVIGWTKLQIIGRYLTDDNSEYLLQLAEQFTAHDLEVHLRGEIPIQDARVVQLYLAQSDYLRLREVLIAFGAIPSGNGLVKMEGALMRLVDEAAPQN